MLFDIFRAVIVAMLLESNPTISQIRCEVPHLVLRLKVVSHHAPRQTGHTGLITFSGDDLGGKIFLIVIRVMT